MARWNCIEQSLCNAFDKFGRLVARNPLPFVLVPCIVTGILLIGFVRFEVVTDMEDLYTPQNGPAKDEQAIVRQLFPEDHEVNFTSLRRSTVDGEFRVIITLNNRENILNSRSFAAIFDLDDVIKARVVDIDGTGRNYSWVCAKYEGACEENYILEVYERDPDLVGEIPIMYPLDNGTFMGFQLGGVTVDDSGTVTKATAVMLAYYVKYVTQEEEETSDIWLDNMVEYFSKVSIDNHTVYYLSSRSLEDELGNSVHDIVPLFSITYTIIFTFSIMSSMMFDWVRSKPWSAFGGLSAACLAIASALGLMSACGVDFATTVASMPFLILGIGIDDMFVILTSWRHTDVTKNVEDRMGEAFRLSAVSITLTSLTNILAFCIGAITQFYAIRLFCAYTGVAVVFCYVYAITFFAGCLAYSGRREEANKHVATCQKATPRDQAEERGTCFRIWCVGGLTEPEKETPDNQPIIINPLLTNIITDSFGPLLAHWPTKALTILLYMAYLGVASWGCSSVKQGLQLQNLAPDDSYAASYYDVYNEYFYNNYGPNTMVVITESIDYSDDSVRDRVFELTKLYQESDSFIDDDNLTVSWLSEFENYLLIKGENPPDMPEYITLLKEFFTFAEKFSLDVKLNAENTEILASRIFVQSEGISDTLDERDLMLESRDLAEQSEFETTAFSPGFIYYDQYTVILQNTVQNLLIALMCMLVVSLLLVPNLVAVICTFVSVASICIGVIGFMAFWDVNLDSVSMINLIMCIGFSVDFSAHISYHFTISKEPDGNAKASDAVGHLGTPIIQGALSTILGVSVLSAADTYIFRTFFKIITLVMIFGFFHAMFVLPVVLSTVYNWIQKCTCRNKQTAPITSSNTGIENKACC